MNAMSDVAFLLLIFIMLVALINYRREVKIDYPEAESARRTSAEKNLEIWIDVSGRLYLDGIPAESAEGSGDALRVIENAVGDAYQNAPDTRIHIIADKNTPFRNISSVLELLQILEYRMVSFVVKNEP
jgi:biopolymer transport protein ExbD